MDELERYKTPYTMVTNWEKIVMDDLKDLMDRIGYHFKNVELLECALTHRSYDKQNNERLEFLGDSLVNFIVAAELFEKFPEAQEGQLSRLRASLVKGETLSELAKEFNVGETLRLGFGEIKTGGRDRVSILADSMEAILGAVYLDANLEVCYKIVVNWYQERFSKLSLDYVYKDPKSLLQEYLQARQLQLPEYEMVKVNGKEHEQIFVVECSIALLKDPVYGEGTSRRKAEQMAADRVLKVLNYE